MRRIHIPALITGAVRLSAAQAHHVRDVLRLEAGIEVEAFDDAGHVARAMLVEVSGEGVVVRIETIERGEGGFGLTVAAAVPKGGRADWMIEKLSELGVGVFIPLATARAVALPEGAGKLGRWNRLALEAAKQSRRQGVMEIRPLAKLGDVLGMAAEAGEGRGWCYLSTEADAPSVLELTAPASASMTLLIGPEGGWTEGEVGMFREKRVAAGRLTGTVLRTETAAIAAAAVIMSAAAARQAGAKKG